MHYATPFAARGSLTALILAGTLASAADWPRFRGLNGGGVNTDSKPLPTEWSESRNLKWKTQLPGPGQSSPIVVGDAVYVTCWSGYGVDRSNPGNKGELQRHLVCIDRGSGSIRWNKSVPAVQPEEDYRGMFAEHGYASHTPVSDGERVYAFFGKSGVYAFDRSGHELWHKSVGIGDDRRSWGTASSPILHQNLLIVPAFVESHALVAFDKLTGEERWRQEADGFDSTWSTPVLVDLPESRTDLVVAVPFEVWGLNPETGKLRWYCSTFGSDSACPSPIVLGNTIYLSERRDGGTIAIRAGGSGDVTATHVVWKNQTRGGIGSIAAVEGRLYLVARGIVTRMEASTGADSGRPLRLERSSGSEANTNGNDPAGRPPERRPGEPGESRGGFGGGRGGPGGQDYSSPIVADGKLYYFTRSGDGLVVELGAEPRQLATNRFASDSSDFSATPAVSDGALFVRSNRFLYCIAAE